MKSDPFGNLTDWCQVLDTLEDLAENGDLSKCQPGLIRVLRYKGNWRLREEVLKRVGDVQMPSNELVHQVISILDDDNTYYDARILAGDALIKLLRHHQSDHSDGLHSQVRNVINNLTGLPQPPFFNDALNRMNAALDQSEVEVTDA
jgi:hypothetical protein